MQDGAPPHITRYGRSQTLLHRRTCDQPLISSSVASPIACLNPTLFLALGPFKTTGRSCDQPKTLPDLKDSVSRHVLNISQNTLRSND
ncbi:hypothetical protein TNCV_2969481 [Trichonephila clavipes]|nr:hypothetical protein TNCV_2969481 [Trichonephila clavipes]